MLHVEIDPETGAVCLRIVAETGIEMHAQLSLAQAARLEELLGEARRESWKLTADSAAALAGEGTW